MEPSSPDSLSPDSSLDPHSSLTLTIQLSVGYQRKRARLGTRWEGPIVTVLFAIGGIIVVVLFLLMVTGWFRAL